MHKRFHASPRIVAKRMLLLGALAMAPAMAQAQMRGGGGGGGGPTVVGAPFDKVAIGTWGEYELRRGEQPARKTRHALVGKEGAAFVLETSSESPRGGKTITRTVVDADPTKEGAVKKVIVQMGDNDPMEMPQGRGGGGPGERGGGMRFGARFLKPDAKTLVGKETVKVPAGTFQAEHHRTEGPNGGKVDFWVAKDAGPLGLIKMEMDIPARPDGEGGGKLKSELLARGKGAKPEITKPAKPFDPSQMRGFGGPGEGGGRGPRGRGGPGGH
jgi:hypothetical protein